MIKLEQVTLGSDCEVFLRTKAGAPFPVCGLLGGTKEEPIPMWGLKDGFAHQEDNAAVEFNIPPEKTVQGFVNNLHKAAKFIEKKLPPSLVLDYEHSSVEFDKAFVGIDAMKSFGCQPDFNAWTMSVNPRPVPQTPGFRSASCHVHIGWCAEGEQPEIADQIELVRLCDVFVVLPHLVYEDDSERARRKLYGKAGSFRPKPYGVEHRVLGNKWAFNTTTAIKVTKSYFSAINSYIQGLRVQENQFERIQKLINEFDPMNKDMVNEAAILHKAYKKTLAEKLYGSTTTIQ